MTECPLSSQIRGHQDQRSSQLSSMMRVALAMQVSMLCLGALLSESVSFVNEASAQGFVDVQSSCLIEGNRDQPCLPSLLSRPIQRARSVFYLQARVSPNKVPSGRGELSVFINLSTPEGRVVCTESFESPVKIRDGVLNVEVGRGMDCALDEVLAENTNLKIQLCLGSSSSCLRPIDLTSVPFAFSANIADEVAQTRTTTMAAQSLYTQRVTADPDVIFPTRVGYGYFDFYTHPEAERGTLYPDVAQYAPYAQSGFIQWTPVRGYEGPGSRFGANRVYIVAESAQGELKLLKSVSVMAATTRTLGRVTVREGHVEVLGDDSASNQNIFQDDLTVGRRAETPRLKVTGELDVTGDTIITTTLNARSMRVSGSGDLRGEMSVGNAEIEGSAIINTRVAELGAVTLGGALTADVPSQITVRGGATIGSGPHVRAIQGEESVNEVDANLPAQRGLLVARSSSVEGGVTVTGETTLTRDARTPDAALNSSTQGVWMRSQAQGTKRRVFASNRDGDVLVNQTPPIAEQQDAPQPARVRIKANRVVFEQRARFEAGRLGEECTLTREAGGTTFSFQCGDQTLRFASDQCGNGRRFRCSCGDGELNLGEECDDGDSDNSNACLNNCLTATCGDGYARGDLSEGEDGYEECDDKNQDNTDACTNDCILARCGDDILRTDLNPEHHDYEECDDGNLTRADACTDRCRNARCGDGIQRLDLQSNQAGYEACDDGNSNDRDGCRNSCEVARCGDGVLRADLSPGQPDHEACDDGNLIPDDACTDRCQIAVCGDGVRRADLPRGHASYEECDDGDQDRFDGCTDDCVIARCGDGIVRRDLGPGAPGYEECDDRSINCTSQCQRHCDVVPLVRHLHQEEAVVNVSTRGNPRTNTSAGGGGGQAAIALSLNARSRVTFETTAQNYDAYFHLRAQCDDRVSIAHDDDSSSLGRLHPKITRWLDPGTYYLIVDGYARQEGDATVRVELDQCTGVPVDHVISPFWDGWSFLFGFRLFPTLGHIDINNEGGATVRTRRCGGNGPQRAIRIELPQAAHVSFHTEGGPDPVLHLRDQNDCGRADDLTCDDDGGSGLNAAISTRLAAGTYYLIVDGYYGKTGSTRVHYQIY